MIEKIYNLKFSSKFVQKRFEKLLAMFHYNSCFGHSNIFGMFLDGDGNEKIIYDDKNDNFKNEIDLVGGVGFNVEIAHENICNGIFMDKNKKYSYFTKDNKLYRNNEVIKEI